MLKSTRELRCLFVCPFLQYVKELRFFLRHKIKNNFSVRKIFKRFFAKKFLHLHIKT